MTVLSDATIRELIRKGKLVLGGDPVHASHCAYNFRPARVIFGGTTAEHRPDAIELEEGGSTSATILPTRVAWVQSREKVAIPRDMVGLWIQTNSLSRQGLLLLNSTLVEPGYEGFLSAHLVNLGAQPATIGANDTIAKLVFISLDREATDLVQSTPYQDYNVFIDRLAARSHPSFLRISEFIPDLRLQVEDLQQAARRDINAHATVATKTISAELTSYADSVVKDAKEKLFAFEQRTFRRVGGGFVLGVILALGLLAYALPKWRDLDAESSARIRVVVQAENDRLLQRVQELEGQAKQRSAVIGAPQSARPLPSGAQPVP